MPERQRGGLADETNGLGHRQRAASAVDEARGVGDCASKANGAQLCRDSRSDRQLRDGACSVGGDRDDAQAAQVLAVGRECLIGHGIGEESPPRDDSASDVAHGCLALGNASAEVAHVDQWRGKLEGADSPRRCSSQKRGASACLCHA